MEFSKYLDDNYLDDLKYKNPDSKFMIFPSSEFQRMKSFILPSVDMNEDVILPTNYIDLFQKKITLKVGDTLFYLLPKARYLEKLTENGIAALLYDFHNYYTACLEDENVVCELDTTLHWLSMYVKIF